ncbi:MAG: septal ring lytic transglycosylase RlpA family protein [Pseudomonadota bacterium]
MRTLACMALALLAGCSFQPRATPLPPVSVPADPTDPTPRPEPRSRYGNPESYTQFGRRYRVLSTADGFRERGIASWYGEKFHGRRTSSGETYDMFAMSAAHKTLPLPTWVEVRNLKNNRRIVVRINDRGPFVANRVIDLSYEAAKRLDIVRDGTGLVEVRALEFDSGGVLQAARPNEPLPETVVRQTTAAAPDVTTPPVQDDSAAVAEPTAEIASAGVNTPLDSDAPAARLFAQVGAFASLDNAEGMFIRLRETGFAPVDIVTRVNEQPELYRVRVGPVANAIELDATVERLKASGIGEVQVVIE